jgi:hypothetical protein
MRILDREFFDKRKKQPIYELRAGVQDSPAFAEMREYLKELMANPDSSATLLKELTQMEGALGKKINDFLQPYTKVDGGFRIKTQMVEEQQQNLQILEGLKLKEFMTNEEFFAIFDDPQLSTEANFINPVAETSSIQKFSPNKRAQKEDGEWLAEMEKLQLATDKPGRLTWGSIHRAFDGCKQEFNQDIYKFIVDNFDSILATPERQSMVKVFQARHASAEKFFKENGGDRGQWIGEGDDKEYFPSFLDIKDFCDNIPFEYSFGRKEFAEFAKNAGVKDPEAYKYYESKLPALESRVKTTLPRHEKTYTFVAPDEKEYKVMGKMLRCDDSLNMLVGESNFTNCCQVFNNAGSKCMEHATENKSGGIFATYLIGKDGVPMMLTQSWTWTNEHKMCLDNVEATSLITKSKDSEKKLMRDIATFAIQQSANDIIQSSEEVVNAYYEREKAKLERSTTLTPEQKAAELALLDEFKQRQTLSLITVGSGCDDLALGKKAEFVRKTLQDDNIVIRPKGYEGYTDAKGQYTLAEKEGVTPLPQSDTYEERAIYKDARQVAQQRGGEITHSSLRHITNIEQAAHKPEMLNYTEEGKPKLASIQALARTYNCRPEHLRIIAGEDWYYVYGDDGKNMEIYDIAKTELRTEDEGQEQQNEMNSAFKRILTESVVLDESQQVQHVKNIKAQLREDTSYLLWLGQKKHGIISQQGSDVLYRYNDDEGDKREFTEQEQTDVLKNMRTIRNAENTQLNMHKVEFTPSEESIQKIIEKAKQLNKGEMEKDD